MTARTKPFASPTCFARELNEYSDDEIDFDYACWRDVKRWRVSQRKTLLSLRKQMPEKQREREVTTVTNELDQLLQSINPRVMSVYWPIFSEMNLSHWAEKKSEEGLQLCLPVVTQRKRPLSFCYWKPGERMKTGEWGIPIPSDKKIVKPDLVVVPLLGSDAEQHRLGYGGGYYDRTLATLANKVTTIGVGFSTAKIPTIFPQPHDITLEITILGK